MHKSNRVMHQFEFRQSIPPSPQDIEALHNELATSPDYMSWFRHHGKPYLLLEEARTRQHRIRRLRQHHINPRSRVYASMESSSTPTQHKAPRVAPSPRQHDSYCFGDAFTNPIIFTQAPHYAPLYPVSTPSISYATPYTYLLIVLQTPSVSLSTEVVHLHNDMLVERKTYNGNIGGHHTQPQRKRDKDGDRARGKDEDNEYEELEPQLL
ncbi:hypothetical protein Gotur_012514 [Gossypium turneri]